MADAKAPLAGVAPEPLPCHPRVNVHPAWLPGKSAQFLATILINIISFSFGCVCGWPSVAGPQLRALGASEEALSWVASLVWPAGLVGAAVFGPLTDRWGRRPAALAVAVPLVLGWAALWPLQFWIDFDAVVVGVAADSDNVTGILAAEQAAPADMGLTMVVVLVARALLGVGMGGVLIVCPVYVGEVVEDSLRGQLGSYMALFVNVGILYVYAVGALVGWGALALLCGVFPAAFVAAFSALPETPTFLLSRGDEPGALAALTWMRDPRCSDVDAELSALRGSLKRGEGETTHHGSSGGGISPRDLVATRAARHALLIVLGLLGLQQFSGITAIINYANTIFAMAGSSMAPELASVVLAAVQLAGSLASCVLADRLGRLPLLYASYGGMTASLALMGACFAWPELLPRWLPVACLSVYILVYAVASGPAPFVLLVDVFPAHQRAVASQAGLAFLFTIAFLVSKFFSALSDALGAAGCFWLFGACCAAGVAFVRFAIPETKGRAVDDIVAELSRGRQRARGGSKANHFEMA